jgi:hypothetical protein
VIQTPQYQNPLAIAMPRGFERARVNVKVTDENFADVMTVVAEMLRNGAEFHGPPHDFYAPHKIRERLAAHKVARAPDDLRDEAAAAPNRRTRKPSIATLVKRAEKAGKPVTSITTPDGTTIHFGETKPTDASNPWLADIEKATKQ